MNADYTLTKEEARRFILCYQGLLGKSLDIIMPKKAIMDYMNKVRTIQYDPLDVVGRNPDLVLQARVDGYKKEHLFELLYGDRKLLDGWDKMMSIVLMEDWNKLTRVREKMAESVKRTLKHRKSIKALELIEEVYEYVKNNGPTKGKDINLGSVKKGSWGHGKLSSAALDYMFHEGILCVYSKAKAIRTFDLCENVVPKNIVNLEDPFEDEKEFLKWRILRRLGSVGMLWARSGGGWLGYGISKATIRKPILKDLHENGEIKKIKIEGLKEDFYIREDLTYLIEKAKQKFTYEMKIIAPLDNMMWDRDLLEKLFDFKYRWEVYTPVAKREYGYYVLPVIYKDEFVGRFEPEHHRNSDELIIKNWWWEENTKVTDELLTARNEALNKFSEYLGASGYKIID